jgi:hypothetical protein
MPDEIINHRRDDVPFQPLTRMEMGQELLNEFPDGFQIHTTKHYVFCHNTSEVYATWCGALFEKLFDVFYNFWNRRGMKLHEPEIPLVAILFRDIEGYKRYSRSEYGFEVPENMGGYYHIYSSRVVTCDLTGIHSARQTDTRRLGSKAIQRMLASPDGGRMVATIIHEATHQIAYSSGLQTRLAPNPYWLSEGIAMYFETPRLGSSRGWTGIGINRGRLNRFKENYQNRPPKSLEQLIASDGRMTGRTEEKMFQSAEAVETAYAESWSLTYYLVTCREKEFLEYVEMLGAKSPMIEYTPEERRADFEAYFGSLRSVDADLVKRLTRLR